MLIRRPVAEWIMRGLNSSIQNVRMLLLQSSEDELSGDVGGGDAAGGEQDDGSDDHQTKLEEDLLYIDEDEEESLKRHYFFSVNKYVCYIYSVLFNFNNEIYNFSYSRISLKALLDSEI